MIISPYIVPGLPQLPLMRTSSEKQQRVIEIVTKFMRVSFDRLTTRNRRREIVDTRRLIMYFLREEGFKLTTIGKLFKQDHSTVIHAIDTMNDLIFSDPDTKWRVQYIRGKIEMVKSRGGILKANSTI